MSNLKLDYMPTATRVVFNRLQKQPGLAAFTLVGGTALALQIGHRISEDLDFNVFESKLPTRTINQLLDNLADDGCKIQSLISSEKKSQFKINTGKNLDNHIQDYLIDNAKVSFHARGDEDRPRRQIEFLKNASKHTLSKGAFSVMGIEGLAVMKSLVVYDRVKSRDLYDLMALTRDHGYTLAYLLDAIDRYMPARNKDPEHFKRVVTGIIAVDRDDEGFASIHLRSSLQDIYSYFRALLNDYETAIARQLKPD